MRSKMERECANSSESLLRSEEPVVAPRHLDLYYVLGVKTHSGGWRWGGEALTSPCLRIWLPVGPVERGNHAAPALCHPDEPPARPSPCGDPCTGTWAAARGENSTCEPAPTGTAISLGGVGWGEEEVGEEPEFKGLRGITDLFTLCL